ncbi:polysaccharide biosynthesis protein [Cellulomonas flavigena DSM 20109]|uniref:Polysaccharide biosynthesis protein n=1 Tax=Cellulomonas flavigena (strain ATCC 482 / DSM 20109 / BCRC 11376 / JCM 18109 / NBRC 3775 / NCIMB 8073 / NRS 134) TaxID=446466 RepID=D5UJD0_CELFN|nr:lipopolysaccharide biosynthesis protein [Cellulomonas flavigena]ADG73653.1 polysaccharide biosynthesis protein [Cellulomonas flavigena DSM 20109]
MTADERLGVSASRGAAVTLVGQGARIALLLTGVVVLARLLSPRDYGLLAMVMAVIGVADLLRDFGLGSAAVQARTLSVAQRSNLLWLSTGIGAALGLLVLVTSPLLAAFYDEPRLQPVAAALSVTFVLNGVMTQYKADLQRRLRFAWLTGLELAGQAVGIVTAVALAAGGAGYHALVAQQVVQLAAQLVGLLLVCRWLPRRWSREAPVRPFVSFGAHLMGGQVLAYASNNVDSVVIGSTLGPGPLGVYNRAFQLLVLPLYQLNAPVTRVALPVLSRLVDDPVRYRQFLLTGQTAMLNLVSAVLAFAAAQAPAVVLVALGPRWSQTAGLFQVLAVAGFFTMAGYACYWVYLSRGLTREHLRLSLVTRPVQIVLVVAGAQWGLYGIAWAYALATALQWPANLWWLHRVTDAPVGQIWRNGARTVLVYGWALVASATATRWLPAGSTWTALAVGAVALGAALALAALVVPAYRRDLQTVAALRRQLRGTPTATTPAADRNPGHLPAPRTVSEVPVAAASPAASPADRNPGHLPTTRTSTDVPVGGVGEISGGALSAPAARPSARATRPAPRPTDEEPR